MKIATKAWTEILVFYKGLKDKYQYNIQPMIDLVSVINQSSYSSGIYAYTSHSVLCIGQHQQLSESNALLKIYYRPDCKKFTFEYKGDMTSKFSWSKSFHQNNVIKEFEFFLKELKWVI